MLPAPIPFHNESRPDVIALPGFSGGCSSGRMHAVPARVLLFHRQLAARGEKECAEATEPFVQVWLPEVGSWGLGS